MRFPWLKITGRGASIATRFTAQLIQPPSPLLRIATLLLAFYILYHAWDFFVPPKPALSPSLRDVAARVIPQIVADLRNASPHSAALLHIDGDATDYLTNSLRQAVEANNVLELRDTTFAEKLRDLVRMNQPGYGSTDAAVIRGQALGVPAVLFGAVRQFSSTPSGEARLDLDIALADVAAKKLVFSKNYTEQIGGSLAGTLWPAIDSHLVRQGLFSRLLAWAVIVMLLPVFTITFIRAMVRKESNGANAFTLFVYTVVDALLAYLIIGVDLHSLLSMFLLVIFVGMALVYNIFVMTFALRLET